MEKTIETLRVYTPTQIGLGTFLGGPFAGTFFLWKNFKTLKKEGEAKQTLIGGIVLSAILIGILPFLPERFPNIVVTMGYLIPTMAIVKGYQLSKEAIEEAEEYDFRSSWGVFGTSIILALLFLAVAFVIIYGLLLADIITV